MNRDNRVFHSPALHVYIPAVSSAFHHLRQANEHHGCKWFYHDELLSEHSVSTQFILFRWGYRFLYKAIIIHCIKFDVRAEGERLH